MVHIILQERTFDCVCKRIHAEKYASVLVDIREGIHGLNENSYITYLTILLKLSKVGITYET